MGTSGVLAMRGVRGGAVRRMLGVALAAAVGAALAVAVPGAAHAAELNATPPSIAVGETTTVVATGLGGLEQAFFGLGDTSAGVFTENGAASYTAPVSGGQASATFQAATAGTVTVAVSDGETVLGTVEVTVTGAPAPQPQAEAKVSLTPSSVEVGEEVTVTVSGLGGLETASIGTDSPGSGTFADGGDGTQAPVTAGSATTTFTPSKAGDIVISVGDGETVLATATLTVTEAATPTPTVTAVPISQPTDDGVPALVWVIVALVVVILAGAIIWIVTARRKRRQSPPAS